jgi:beta-1,4-N-acetylglucosaminyltransferase
MPFGIRNKICIAASPGGHLQELLALSPLFKKFDCYYLTFDVPMLSKFKNNNKVYLLDDASKGLFKLMKNSFNSLIIILKERPSLLITSGAGVVLPTLLFAKILRVKIIYIELTCQVYKLTKTGAIAYYFSDLFIVQNPDLISSAPKSILVSSLERFKSIEKENFSNIR